MRHNQTHQSMFLVIFNLQFFGIDTATCWVWVHQNVLDLSCAIGPFAKNCHKTWICLQAARHVTFGRCVLPRPRCKGCRVGIIESTQIKVPSEKISTGYIWSVTGSMDFREAFGLRPADVKTFIHSACQEDTVDTRNDAGGGAGKTPSLDSGFKREELFKIFAYPSFCSIYM